MQFFSLTPITLDLAASDRQIGRRRADSVVIDERDDKETARMEGLVTKMALHFPRRKNQPIEGAQILVESIDQVVLPPVDQTLMADKQCMGTFRFITTRQSTIPATSKASLKHLRQSPRTSNPHQQQCPHPHSPPPKTSLEHTLAASLAPPNSHHNIRPLPLRNCILAL